MPGLLGVTAAASRAALAASLANFFSRFVGTRGRFICSSVEEVDESDSNPSSNSYHQHSHDTTRRIGVRVTEGEGVEGKALDLLPRLHLVNGLPAAPIPQVHSPHQSHSLNPNPIPQNHSLSLSPGWLSLASVSEFVSLKCSSLPQVSSPLKVLCA